MNVLNIPPPVKFITVDLIATFTLPHKLYHATCKQCHESKVTQWPVWLSIQNTLPWAFISFLPGSVFKQGSCFIIKLIRTACRLTNRFMKRLEGFKWAGRFVKRFDWLSTLYCLKKSFGLLFGNLRFSLIPSNIFFKSVPVP